MTVTVKQRIAVLVMVMLVVATVAPTIGWAQPEAQPERHPGRACGDVAGLEPHAEADGQAAVVLVHGWTGKATMWKEGVDRSINRFGSGVDATFASLVDGVPGLDAWLLDYRQVSGRWVTSPDAAGDRLEAAVRCLADAYGQPVAIVGHSMGGLAAREVVDRVGTGLVSTVVTLGTPHTGSDYALLAAVLLDLAPVSLLASGDLVGSAVSTAMVELLWLCGRATTIDLGACGPWLAPVLAFDGEAGRALRTGSSELADLARLPADMPSMAIAGDLEIRTIHRRLFGLSNQETVLATLGDLVVGTGSAVAQATESHVHRCGHLLAVAPDAALLSSFGYAHVPHDVHSINVVGSPCAHWHFSHTLEVVNKTMSFLTEFATPIPPLAEDDILQAWVPSMCDFPEGRLDNGVLPLAHPDLHDAMPPRIVQEHGVVLGDLTQDGIAEAAAVFNCNLGGVGHPDHVVVFRNTRTGPQPLGDALSMGALGAARHGTFDLSFHDGSLRVHSSAFRTMDAACCPRGQIVVSVAWNGQELVADIVDRDWEPVRGVRSPDRPTCDLVYGTISCPQGWHAYLNELDPDPDNVQDTFSRSSLKVVVSQMSQAEAVDSLVSSPRFDVRERTLGEVGGRASVTLGLEVIRADPGGSAGYSQALGLRPILGEELYVTFVACDDGMYGAVTSSLGGAGLRRDVVDVAVASFTMEGGCP